MSRVTDKRIMVCSQSTAFIRMEVELLHQVGFHNVDKTYTASEALEMVAHKHPYGLLMASWNMEPITGYELLKQVRESADDHVKSLPFLMVLDEAKSDIVKAAEKAGANGYIVKPFDAMTLKGVLAKILGDF